MACFKVLIMCTTDPQITRIAGNHQWCLPSRVPQFWLLHFRKMATSLHICIATIVHKLFPLAAVCSVLTFYNREGHESLNNWEMLLLSLTLLQLVSWDLSWPITRCTDQVMILTTCTIHLFILLWQHSKARITWISEGTWSLWEKYINLARCWGATSFYNINF